MMECALAGISVRQWGPGLKRQDGAAIHKRRKFGGFANGAHGNGRVL